MYPGDDPASMQKRDRTKAVMAQASGKTAVNLILDCRHRYEIQQYGSTNVCLKKKQTGRKTRLIVRVEKVEREE
jgi:hypothetical protein